MGCYDNFSRDEQNPIGIAWPNDEYAAIPVQAAAFTDYDAMLLEAMKIAPWDGQS